MTLEFGSWQGHNDRLSEQKTNTPENALNNDDSKRVLKIRSIFGGMLQTATGPYGMLPIPRPMDEFDLMDRVFKIGKDKADYGKAALFADGLWFVATTSDDEGLVQSRHELTLYHDETDENRSSYQISPLNRDRDDDPDDRYMEGVEQIADGIDDMLFGEIVRAFKIQVAKRWPGQLSPEEATYAHAPGRGLDYDVRGV